MKKVLFLLSIVYALASCDSVRRIQKLYPEDFPIDIYKECVDYCDGSLQENIDIDSLYGVWTWESWGGDKMGLTLTVDGRYTYTSEWIGCSKTFIEGTYEWQPEQNKLVLHNYFTKKKIRKDYDLRLKCANLPHKEMIVTQCQDGGLCIYRLGGITMYYSKE